MEPKSGKSWRSECMEGRLVILHRQTELKKKDHLGMARSLDSIYRGCRPECEQMVLLFFSENMYNVCT